MSEGGGKILVIRGGAIGDFILTLPAIAALRRQFPEAHLEVLGYPHIVRLAVEGGLVNRAEPIEARALAGFFARGGDLSEDMADYFSEFDLIVSYLYDPDLIFRTNIARCTGAQFISGPHRPDLQDRVHAAKAYLKPLESLAIFGADPVPSLPLKPRPSPARPAASGTDDIPHATAGLRRKQLALHPGSGSETKNWPEANWSGLLERLINGSDFNLLLVGGEAEGERLQRLGAALPPARLRVAQNLPLPELARVLAGCSLFLGHDSGISHLAAAVGLGGLLLWSDTDEEVWRPLSSKMHVLKHPGGITNLTVQEVCQRLLSVK